MSELSGGEGGRVTQEEKGGEVNRQDGAMTVK